MKKDFSLKKNVLRSFMAVKDDVSSLKNDLEVLKARLDSLDSKVFVDSKKVGSSNNLLGSGVSEISREFEDLFSSISLKNLIATEVKNAFSSEKDAILDILKEFLVSYKQDSSLSISKQEGSSSSADSLGFNDSLIRKIISSEIRSVLSSLNQSGSLKDVSLNDSRVSDGVFADSDVVSFESSDSFHNKKSSNSQVSDSLSTRLTVDDSLKKDLLKAYEKNRKNIVKQQILNEINKSNPSRKDLKSFIVDEKKYCSKASFYRYLEELSLTGAISFQNRLNKTFISATSSVSNDFES